MFFLKSFRQVPLSIFGLLMVSFSSVQGQANVPTPNATAIKSNPGAAASTDFVDGPKISDYQTRLKTLFPEATSFKELTFLPSENGGSSLMGLIHRLLGEQVQRNFEGLKTRRFIYLAMLKDQPIGLAHASTTEVGNNLIDVVVYYDANGTIRDLQIEKAPPDVLAALQKGGYLTQFAGKTSEDFEFVLGRRGRIKSRGPFLSQSRKPAAAPVRTYFDKIMRSVRFNTAFMEVAYFIVQHPEDNVAQ